MLVLKLALFLIEGIEAYLPCVLEDYVELLGTLLLEALAVANDIVVEGQLLEYAYFVLRGLKGGFVGRRVDFDYLFAFKVWS